jgi:hypothetical protein
VTPRNVHSSPKPWLAPARTTDVYPQIIHCPNGTRNRSHLRPDATALSRLTFTRSALPVLAACQTVPPQLFRTIEHP